jgi:hypothetical protein
MSVPRVRSQLACTLAIAAVVVLAAVVARPQPAFADEQRIFVRDVPDEPTWNKYSKTLNADQFGKFIIDVKSNDIYFFDVNLFKLHADFVLGILLKQAWTAENIREYNRNYERDKPRFILGYITHHLKVDRWAFSFWEGDKIDAATVHRAYKRLQETFYVKDLTFRPDSPLQEKVAVEVKKKGVKTITNDEIYKASDYQAFNKGAATGRLRVVPIGTPYEDLIFDRTEIALLQEVYPDISPVAGILSTKFSTPLAHVNLRATAWGIPNAGYVKAREEFAALDGEIVRYEVGDSGVVVRKATEQEVAAFETAVQQERHVAVPPANISNARFTMLTRMRAKDVTSFGAKSANLGEIVTANVGGVNVPEGFGVPFFYYVRHMKQHGLDQAVDAMLADGRWKTDAAWRKSESEKLRATILERPIDPDVLDTIYKRVRVRLGGRGVFVRSSTNAEDLPGFNGAGLYDTVANVRGKKQIGEAIKTVWASLWNFRAVEERSLFGIDHRQVYAAVLIQIGVDASAAGVLITRNLFDPSDDNSFTINAKWGLGMRVVEGTKVPEQIVYDTSNFGTKIISRSDEPTMLVFDDKGGIREVPVDHDGVILSEERARRLSTMVQAFHPLFAKVPLDVEWVFEGETVWIVQARPYIGR